MISHEVNANARCVGLSASLMTTLGPPLHDLAAQRMVGDKAAIGELRNIHDARYPNFFGVFALHALFHTPIDSAAMTGPEALDAVERPLAAALRQIADGP